MSDPIAPNPEPNAGTPSLLVKPFSARELMTRVRTHLEIARVRRAATDAARELAETRAALLADLKRKNKELEAFSYSVSHDLRAPLRSIDGFSRALLEDHGTDLGEAGRRIVERHGGRVWAEGAVGHGATVCWTLSSSDKL